MRSILTVTVFAAAALLTIGCGDSNAQSAAATAAPAAKVDAPKPVEQKIAIISTTEGDITLALRPDKAPKTVENFIKLAESGFYNGTAFHRVIKDFMIQGGDPKTKDLNKMPEWGTGGPGYQIKAEFNDLPHERGTLSMARSAHPDSAGSQFFICHRRTPHLDGHYTVFGKLIAGDDVLEKIATTSVSGSRPNKRIEIKSIVIKTVDAK